MFNVTIYDTDFFVSRSLYISNVLSFSNQAMILKIFCCFFPYLPQAGNRPHVAVWTGGVKLVPTIVICVNIKPQISD